MANLAIATEIRNQLGRKALFMMGAYDLVGDTNALAFKFKGCKKFKYVRIELKSNDLYTVTFKNWRNFETTAEKSIEGVYCDMLHDIIEKETGLYLSL